MSQKDSTTLRADVAAALTTDKYKNAEQGPIRTLLTDVLDSVNPVSTGIMTDDNDAATTGEAVNVVQEAAGVGAYLVSTTANDASFLYEVGDGGPSVKINDSDSPGGVQLYFDHDATNADEKFMAVSPDAKDILIPLSNGTFLRVVHNADAATDGLAVYGDDDAADAFARLLFVSPSDADVTFTTDDSIL